ncbi:MAG TPA: DegT/DnrJ/EryC1/StrS family aminotransferase [Pirellulales bacterium]|jgi:dTDP-4-amino-4,6-dideoxygalactose transaminase|nr:DegT/DnrJ/EryC1/StrS family aminotransferase [Pirellulales bacterium]
MSTPGKDAASNPSPNATPVPLIDMQRQYRELEPDLLAALTSVCASGRFVLGPECGELEQSLAKYCRAPHAIACASGSDALLLALMAIGIGAGDEVIVPSYTFFATASAVTRLGATPVFADIEPSTYNIDPESVKQHITPATRAIIPVHRYGQAADMSALQKIAKPVGLTLIEDACQAIGAEYRGQRAGTLGDIACFSFYPTKNLGGFGDGGLLTTKRDDLAERLKLLRVHGMQPRYHHHIVGINSRLDTLQAAVLKVKLPHLDRWTELRIGHARHYGELFAACGLDTVLTLPTALADRRHVWNQYIVRVPEGKRDALRQHLVDRKIGTEIYYPIPLHRQKCFENLGYAAGSLPHTEAAARETLALPIFPELLPSEQEAVVAAIAGFFGKTTSFAVDGALRGPKFLQKPNMPASRQA